MDVVSLITAFLIGGLAVAVLLRFYVSSYLREKGRNLATKEDIRAITNEIESVKSRYAIVLEELRNRQQLKVVALDRRLQAHQEAFTLWKRLFSSIHETDNVERVQECQDWWNSNCLYLTEEARDAFNAAYHAASRHPNLVESGRGSRNSQKAKELDENFLRIRSAGDIIVESINLPSLHDRELDIGTEK